MITVITTACYVYSGCWLLIEILSHFSLVFEQWSRGNHQMFMIIVIIGLVIGLLQFLQKCAKTLSVSHRLEGQDISIESGSVASLILMELLSLVQIQRLIQICQRI